jgi:hypothetical protein
LLIGITAAALMWVYDILAGPFNALIAAGNISHIGVQVGQVLYYSVVAYAPVNLVFATVSALLVANARAEMNSPLITTSAIGHITVAATIVGAFLANLVVSAFLDTWVLTTSPLGGLDFMGVSGIVLQAFNAAHLLCAIAVLVAYFWMILNSIRIESLQWSV